MIFEQVPPFDFLTAEEKEWLLDRANELDCPDGRVICSPDVADSDLLYILQSGRVVAQYMDHGRTEENHILAPAYFGERSVFFSQPRSAKIVAQGAVRCLSFTGKDIRRLIAKNPTFCQAFAAALRTKQRIFQGYDNFVNLLFSQAQGGLVKIRDLMEGYRGLRSILHPGGHQEEIDFEALYYVLPRLPEDITSTSALFLSEDLPEMYRKVREQVRASSRRAKKREFYGILPGKSLILLRDGMTDTVDLITKLCIYACEASKLRDRLVDSPIAADLARLAMVQPTSDEEKALRDRLPFSSREMAALDRLFGKNLLRRLYEITVQYGDLAVYVKRADNRYSAIASEMWLTQIRELLNQAVPVADPGLEVQIISSNTHSVTNCLSSWSRDHAEEVLDWARQSSPESLRVSHPTDRLYVATREYLKAHPDKAAERAAAHRQQGIFSSEDTCFTGIEVSLIDTQRLSGRVDPDVDLGKGGARRLLVNIDYAYGQQAEAIIRNLILLFGRSIRGISVFGKSGGIVGNRGDILLPDRLILQSTDELYPIPNIDLTAAHLKEAGFGRGVHQGTLLTVLGTIMQNREMLHYYRLFWSVIGMEMEGSYYLREILRARSRGTLRDDVALRFVYYTSDTPLDPAATLATKLSVDEGVGAVYAITRAVLRRIFCR
jgi:hypothetical protein